MTRRSVRFPGNPVTAMAEKSDNYIFDDDIAILWYTSDEVLNQPTDQSSDEGDDVPSTFSLANGNIERVAIRRQEDVIREFLNEQARQKAQGFSDPNALADILSSVSSHRQRIAHLQGLRDAQTAAQAVTRSRSSRNLMDKKEIRARHRLRRAERRTSSAARRQQVLQRWSREPIQRIQLIEP